MDCGDLYAKSIAQMRSMSPISSKTWDVLERGESSEMKTIRSTSIPLPEGGDTHIHPFKTGVAITTRVPNGAAFRSMFDLNGNYLFSNTRLPKGLVLGEDSL